MASYDRKARTALIALEEFVRALPDTIMLEDVCPKRDAFLEAVEALKPKAKAKTGA